MFAQFERMLWVCGYRLEATHRNNTQGEINRLQMCETECEREERELLESHCGTDADTSYGSKGTCYQFTARFIPATGCERTRQQRHTCLHQLATTQTEHTERSTERKDKQPVWDVVRCAPILWPISNAGKCSLNSRLELDLLFSATVNKLKANR